MVIVIKAKTIFKVHKISNAQNLMKILTKSRTEWKISTKT